MEFVLILANFIVTSDTRLNSFIVHHSPANMGNVYTL